MRVFCLLFCSLFAIIITSCQSCEKNPLDPESDNTYTIEGVMYDQDGVTPLKNYPLNIVADKGQTLGGGNDYDYPDNTSTDENGYFKMSYRGNSSYSSLWIGQPANVTPVYGPFLTGIPANKNIERDICIVPLTTIKIKVLHRGRLSKEDSLFVDPILAKPLNDSLFYYKFKYHEHGSIQVYLYTTSKQLLQDTWITNYKGLTNYSGKLSSIRWGIGSENFEKSQFLGIWENSGSNNYNVLSYTQLPFPDTTSVTININ